MRDAAPNWWSVVMNIYAQAGLTVIYYGIISFIRHWYDSIYKEETNKQQSRSPEVMT